MTATSQWIVKGKIASRRDLMEAIALARQHRAKVAQAEREARDRDAVARRVGASIRRQIGRTIRCRPKLVKLKLDGSRRLNRLEKRFGLAMRDGKTGSDRGVSSFHFKLTARGLGSPRRAGGGRYRRREIIATLAYILRLSAREEDDQGIESNISVDPDKLAAALGALEELEIAAGRDNANVYMSLIVSLPEELTSTERKDLLADICGYLAERDLGYVGIQHKPDPIGDQRNFHAHIVFSWRPMTLTPDGCMFAADTLGALNTPEFVTAFRAHAADAMNTAMQAAGHQRRFTAEKTRAGPGNSVTERDGHGRKHRDRRAAQIAAAEQEKAALEDRRSALGAAIEALHSWATAIVPDRHAIVGALRQRQSEILTVLAGSGQAAIPKHAAGYEPERPATPAISHEKRTDRTAEVPAASTATIRTTPPKPRREDIIEPPTTKEFGHAQRSDYASALRDTRRRFAAREPDRREAVTEGPPRPLSGVWGLSTLGLAHRSNGPKMLLHRLSPNQLGDAAGSIVGSGDGVRRPGDGDHGIESAIGIDAPSAPAAEPIADPQNASAPSAPPEMRTNPQTARAMNLLREAARERAKAVRPRKVQPEGKGGDDATAIQAAPAVGIGKPTSKAEPSPTIASAGPAPSSAAAAEQQASPARQNVMRPAGSRDADPTINSREPAIEKPDRDLLPKLAELHLPLRKMTEWKEGRTRTIYSLDVGKAKLEDAELIAMALSQQHTAAYQDLFRRQFDEGRASIRAKLISKPAAKVAKYDALSNPLDDPYLDPALAVAEESPSSKLPIHIESSPSLKEDQGLVDQHWLARRGSGLGE